MEGGLINIELPASKSYAQRYIIAALLSEDEVVLEGLSVGGGMGESEDIEAAIRCAKSLGASVLEEGLGLKITGTGGKFSTRKIEVGESGFCARSLSVVGMLCGGLEVVGSGSLLGRDWGLEEVLSQLKQNYQAGCEGLVNRGGLLNGEGLLGGAWLLGGEFTVDGSISSQVLSGLLMTLPLANGNSTIHVSGLKSKPYVDMTLKVLEDFGIEVQNIDYHEFKIQGGQKYKGGKFTIERDWSAGSYFIALQKIRNEKYNLCGLNPQSLQADRAILQAIKQLEKNNHLDFDATDCPDLVPTLVALCSTLQNPSKIKGTDRLRHKESSRAEVLAQEWRKMDTEIKIEPDSIYIIGANAPKITAKTATIDPHGDHRIAMAAAIMSTNPTILNPQVTAKSFPGFWTELKKIK